MSVCFVFAPEAWEHPLARWTVETVASLIELRRREVVRGERVRDDEAPVFVGPAALAPPGVAATIGFEGWPAWDLDGLALVEIDGVSLPAPGGRAAPWTASVYPPEWLRALGFLLAREEEFLDDRRDEWECFKGTWSRVHELGVLDRPLVNQCAAALERRVLDWHRARGREPERLARWPEGARFAVALTHDVDDVALFSFRGAARLLARARGPSSYAVRGGLRALARAGTAAAARFTGRPAPDPYDAFDRWVALEEAHGARSSFYFVPPDRKVSHENDPTYAWGDAVTFEGRRVTVAAMMERMAARGWEVGLHGGYQSFRDADALVREKRSVEDAARTPVAGGRQHFLRFDVRHTWAAQARAGFAYDATLGYNEAVGCRAGIAAPFRPWDPDARAAHDLIETPLTLMDGTLFRTMLLGADTAFERTREHLERVESAGGLAVLLWHPNAAAEGLFPGWWRSYERTLEWLGGRGAWIAPAAAIASWWREREARATG